MTLRWQTLFFFFVTCLTATFSLTISSKKDHEIEPLPPSFAEMEYEKINSTILRDIVQPTKQTCSRSMLPPLFHPDDGEKDKMCTSTQNAGTSLIRIKRIVGGTKADKTQFPYMVIMKFTTAQGKRAVCGGGILDNYHFVSAGHCFFDNGRLMRNVEVRAHVDENVRPSFFKWLRGEGKIIIRNVREIYLPADYFTKNMDIVIVRVNKSFYLDGANNKILKKLILPEQKTDDPWLLNRNRIQLHQSSPDNYLVIAGFGLAQTNDDKSFTNHQYLRSLKVYVKSCTYSGDPKYICAGPLEGNIGGFCFGDSGSPLVYKGNTDESPHLRAAGIAISNHPDCNDVIHDGRYLRFCEPTVFDFIKEVLNFQPGQEVDQSHIKVVKDFRNRNSEPPTESEIAEDNSITTVYGKRKN